MTYTKNMTKLSNRDIKYIVIHYTAGVTSKKGSAVNTANYFNKDTTKASADFIVDDETVVQYNNDIKNQYTWHAGDSKMNKQSIGIEICSNNSTGKMTVPNDPNYYFTEESLTNAVELVKKLMKEYNIPIENVIRHYDVTHKLCPGILGWTDSKSPEWNKFKERLKEDKPQIDIKATIQTIIKSLQDLLDVL